MRVTEGAVFVTDMKGEEVCIAREGVVYSSIAVSRLVDISGAFDKASTLVVINDACMTTGMTTDRFEIRSRDSIASIAGGLEQIGAPLPVIAGPSLTEKCKTLFTGKCGPDLCTHLEHAARMVKNTLLQLRH